VHFWSEYFEKSTINRVVLNESIDSSVFFIDKTTPSWVKLWNYFDLLDDDFNEILKEVEEKFKQTALKDIGVIKHVVGIFLRYLTMACTQ